MHYYILGHHHAASGPFTAQQMLAKLKKGEINSGTLAAAAGDSGWSPVSELHGLIEEDARASSEPLQDPDARRQVEALRAQAGPRTAPILLKLLEEDGQIHRQ